MDDQNRQPEQDDAAIIADALQASHNADHDPFAGSVPPLPGTPNDAPGDPDAPLEELYTQGAVAPARTGTTGATGSDNP